MLNINLIQKNQEKIEKFLKNFIFWGIGFIIIIVLIPFPESYRDLLLPLGQLIIFNIAVEVLLILYIALIIINPSFRPKFSPILGFVALFWLVEGIATLLSPQPLQSFWSERYRGLGFFYRDSFSSILFNPYFSC